MILNAACKSENVREIHSKGDDDILDNKAVCWHLRGLKQANANFVKQNKMYMYMYMKYT